MSPPLENFPHCMVKVRMLVLSAKLGQTHEKPSEWYIQLSRYSFFTRRMERQARRGLYNRKHLSSVKTKQASAHTRSLVFFWESNWWSTFVDKSCCKKESRVTVRKTQESNPNILLRIPVGLQSVIHWSSACNPLRQLSLPLGSRLPPLSVLTYCNAQIITQKLSLLWMNIESAMMFQPLRRH